jgi:hypothetical protein
VRAAAASAHEARMRRWDTDRALMLSHGRGPLLPPPATRGSQPPWFCKLGVWEAAALDFRRYSVVQVISWNGEARGSRLLVSTVLNTSGLSRIAKAVGLHASAVAPPNSTQMACARLDAGRKKLKRFLEVFSGPAESHTLSEHKAAFLAVVSFFPERIALFAGLCRLAAQASAGVPITAQIMMLHGCVAKIETVGGKVKHLWEGSAATNMSDYDCEKCAEGAPSLASNPDFYSNPHGMEFVLQTSLLDSLAGTTHDGGVLMGQLDQFWKQPDGRLLLAAQVRLLDLLIADFRDRFSVGPPAIVCVTATAANLVDFALNPVDAVVVGGFTHPSSPGSAAALWKDAKKHAEVHGEHMPPFSPDHAAAVIARLYKAPDAERDERVRAARADQKKKEDGQDERDGKAETAPLWGPGSW